MTPDKNTTQTMRKDAIDIFQAGLKAVDPRECVLRCCKLNKNILSIGDRNYDLEGFKRIFVLGAGKAAGSMAGAVEELLQDRITNGIIVVKYGHTKHLNQIETVEAGHPVPDEKGLGGAKTILEMARQTDEKTLVICLISGGGSALMTLPAKGISLKDKQTVTRILLDCGASIHEINTIRKHLSQIKGGQLARAVFPSPMICLVLSDVVGDDLDIIGSGPAVADPGTFAQCIDIIEHYDIGRCLPLTVLQHLKNGAGGLIPETPKKDDPVFESVHHTLIARNFNALAAAKTKARQLGYHCLILSSMIEGETREIALMHAAVAKEISATGNPVSPPACVLSGGETTVTINGVGKGGRNQEFALAFAMKINPDEKLVLLSVGTDGTDGPTDAAGAIVDRTTTQRAAASGLRPELFLKRNDAYSFFEQLSDLIKTGPTNTNVMDLRVLLVR